MKYTFLIIQLIVLLLLIASCKSPIGVTIEPDINSANLKMDLVNGNFQLSWDLNTTNDIVHYNVYSRGSDTASWKMVSSVSNRSWIDSSIVKKNGVFYHEYLISFVNSKNIESDLSSPIAIYTVTDNFNDNINRWYDSSNGSAVNNDYVSDGQLVVNSALGTHYSIFWDTDYWENITMEVDAKAGQGAGQGVDPAIGLDFRSQEEDTSFTYYEYQLVNESSANFNEYKKDHWMSGPTDNLKTNIYNWNRIKVEAIGKLLTGYINGTKSSYLNLTFIPRDLDTLTSGGIGLSTQNGTTYFDNVKVLVTSWENYPNMNKQTLKIRFVKRETVLVNK